MNHHIHTLAVHAGGGPDPHTGAVCPPISLATTFAQDGVGHPRGGFEYSRSGNPTRAALETAIAQLEDAQAAFCFSSGLAALDAVVRLVPDGGTVVCSRDAYGGTLRLVGRLHTPRIEVRVVDLTDLDATSSASAGADLILAESPTNPQLHVVDLSALADIGEDTGAVVAVDSTFCTPYNTTPLAWGADIVIHSTTKYLSGHSDVVGGVVACNDGMLAGKLGFLQNSAGAVPSPFDCYLTLRGIRTLALRMERHARNAEAVARWLDSDPRVIRVHYPGLPGHPHHDLAELQMRTAGGMVSFEVGDAATAARVAASTRLFTLAESLGAVESLIEVPAAMTHATLIEVPLEGVAPPPDGLVRLSVGIEDPGDLIEDLDRALG